MQNDLNTLSLSGTVSVNHNISGTIAIGGGGGSTPVLESLNVTMNPAQSQTITPGEGVDGYNEVKVPQGMACILQSGFVLAMGGSAYDDIVSREYIVVYDTSGRNSTRFYKQSS